MRLQLAGSLIRPSPLVVKFAANGNFIPGTYIAMGYTRFEVICIGAGGGPGGTFDTNNTGTFIKSWGGAGGGGGFHRAKGVLSLLPATVPVVVGAGGAPGVDSTVLANTTNGGDGGASSFNATTCRASGGKGGLKPAVNSVTVNSQANGGDGGIGGRTIAGGGAPGGTTLTPNATTPGTVVNPDGIDGTYANFIGKGGGGGSGGVGKYGIAAGSFLARASNGGRGSYNPGDISVYGPNAAYGADPALGNQLIIAGGAGGAKASPLNGLPTVYGSSKTGKFAGDAGIVVIRLTTE